MMRHSIKKRKWLYKIVMVLVILAYITPAAAQQLTAAGRQAMPSAAAVKERGLAKALLNKRWREFARMERAAALSDIRNKRLEVKKEAGECQKMLKSLFMDGKVYYDSRFYREAIATWYEVLLLQPGCKSERDDRKAELLIINAQKALKNYTEAKIRRHKDQADMEARLARSALEKAKRRVSGKDK